MSYNDAGKPYRPSNGSEGDWFQTRTCYRCARYVEADDDCGVVDAAGLSIIARTWLREEDEPGHPTEWRYDASGMPTCTAWTARPKKLSPLPEAADLDVAHKIP
jgi:YD repeat-containing protein